MNIGTWIIIISAIFFTIMLGIFLAKARKKYINIAIHILRSITGGALTAFAAFSVTTKSFRMTGIFIGSLLTFLGVIVGGYIYSENKIKLEEISYYSNTLKIMDKYKSIATYIIIQILVYGLLFGVLSLISMDKLIEYSILILSCFILFGYNLSMHNVFDKQNIKHIFILPLILSIIFSLGAIGIQIVGQFNIIIKFLTGFIGGFILYDACQQCLPNTTNKLYDIGLALLTCIGFVIWALLL